MSNDTTGRVARQQGRKARKSANGLATPKDERMLLRRVRMVEAALAYAKKGWHVFPAVRSATEKKSHKSAEHSNGRRWGATTDAAEIKRDFKKWPDANIGIATGPSRLLVLDVDTKEGHGVNGPASLRALEKKHGLLPETYEAETPSDGRHLYFKVPKGVIVRNSVSEIGPGLDILGEGGMVLAPPSVRPGKGGYKLVFGRPAAPAPEWLLKLTARPAEANERPSNGEHRGEPERIAKALAVIPNDDLDWGAWNRVGMATFRASGGSEEGFDAFDKWSEKSSSKYEVHEKTRDSWDRIAKSPPKDIGMGTLVYMANLARPGWDKKTTRDDFVSLMKDGKYVYIPTGDQWPAKSVNSQLPPVPRKNRNGKVVKDKDGKVIKIAASKWLDGNKAMYQMIWAPGKPKIIKGQLFRKGEWVSDGGASCLNLYDPPIIKRGDATKVGPWIDHVKRIYPHDYEYIIDYLAHLVQNPGEKPNHALVLGGPVGCGKDTLLAGVRHAIGSWNCSAIEPQDMFGEFNEYVQSVLLQINEARDLGEMSRRAFYEKMKPYEAAPPDVHRCNPKFVQPYSVVNVCGVIYTTNYPDALYLPPDDRRHYVAWSDATYQGLGGEKYFDKLWNWYWKGGFENVAAFLNERDIRHFNPKAAPPKTEAFWTMVNAHREGADNEMTRVIEMLGNPRALTLDCLREADPVLASWINANKTSPAIPNKLLENDYEVVLNKNDKRKGLWVIGGDRQRIYSRRSLSGREQYEAAYALKKDLDLIKEFLG